MDERDIKSLISATAPKMPDVEPDRRELLKRQAQELQNQRQQSAAMHASAKLRKAPAITGDAERNCIMAHLLVCELRKRKRDEQF